MLLMMDATEAEEHLFRGGDIMPEQIGVHLNPRSIKEMKRTAGQSKSGGKQQSKPETAIIKRPKPKVKRKPSKEDPKKPKKPPTAFFYFLEDFRKTYQKQNPDVKSMRDIGKACGEKWKTMSFEEKVAYYDIATEKRAEFDKAMSEYIKKRESCEEESEQFEE